METYGGPDALDVEIVRAEKCPITSSKLPLVAGRGFDERTGLQRQVSNVPLPLAFATVLRKQEDILDRLSYWHATAYLEDAGHWLSVRSSAPDNPTS
jgi:hypothetical protein